VQSAYEVFIPALYVPSKIHTKDSHLKRQAYTAQQVFKARIGSQGIQAWVYFEVREALIPDRVGLLEPREGLVLLPQPSVNQSYFIGADAVCFDVFLQFGYDCARFSHAPGPGIGVAQVT
jgi:hypothetical protein